MPSRDASKSGSSPDTQRLGWHSAASVMLRLAAAGAKFALVLVLARVLTPEDVGVYGLAAAGVTLATYFVGMDYYVVTTRWILTADRVKWPGLVRDHVTLQAGVYVVAVALLGLVFAAGLLPSSIAPWLLPILFFEHLSLEFSRLEIAQRRPLQAHVLLFVRSGSWAILWSGLALVVPASRNLNSVWASWLAAGIASTGMGVAWNRDIVRTAMDSRFDKDRVIRGLTVAGKYLGATLGYYAMLTVDRYFLEALASTQDVGVYTFYIGMAGGVIMIVQSGVVVALFPDLVAAAGAKDWKQHREVMRRMTRMVVLAVAGATTVAGVAIIPALFIIDRPAYEMGLSAYWLLLAGTSLAALSAIPHNVLYSLGHDSEVMIATIAALIVAVVGDVLLIPMLGLDGAAVATAAGFATLFAGKGWYAVQALQVRQPCRGR